MYKRINNINTHQQTLILLCASIDRNEGIVKLILPEKRNWFSVSILQYKLQGDLLRKENVCNVSKILFSQ